MRTHQINLQLQFTQNFPSFFHLAQFSHSGFKDMILVDLIPKNHELQHAKIYKIDLKIKLINKFPTYIQLSQLSSAGYHDLILEEYIPNHLELNHAQFFKMNLISESVS